MTQNTKYLFSVTHCDGVTDENMVENRVPRRCSGTRLRSRSVPRHRSESVD